MTSVQEMTDTQLRQAHDIGERDGDSLLALAPYKDEILIRKVSRDYQPAYVLKVYFSPCERGKPVDIAKDLARRSNRPFTFYDTLGAWENEIETSHVVEFVCNLRTDPYVVAIQDTIKLADYIRRRENQDAVLVTYQGREGMRQWLIDKDGIELEDDE